MKKTILALIAACALCCIPLFIPLLTGASVFGLTLFSRPHTLEAILCAAAPALLAATAVFLLIRSRRARSKGCGNTACAPSGDCGCK